MCDDPDQVKGILSYRNECNFLKVVGDNGNLADEPNLVDGPSGDTNMDPGPQYTNGQWLGAEHPVQTLTPTSAMGNSANGRFGDRNGEGGDGTGSPDEVLSTGLTPNSSSATGSNRLQPGTHMNQSGSSSFNASPIVQGQDMMNGMNGSAGMPNDGVPSFRDMPGASGFVMQTGLGQQQTVVANFASMAGWSDVPQTPGQQHQHQRQHQQQGGIQAGDMGEVGFRSFMDMGSLDGLDLPSAWQDAGTGEMR